MEFEKGRLETINGNCFLVSIDVKNNVCSLPTQNFVWTIVGQTKRLAHSIMTDKDMGASVEIGWHMECWRLRTRRNAMKLLHVR